MVSTYGNLSKIKEVLVITSGDDLAAPCGGCRQRIREFAVNVDIMINVCSINRGLLGKMPLKELLPYSFGPDYLLDKDGASRY